MSEMIERVARAIWADRYPDENFEDAKTWLREDYRGHAMAAIEEITRTHDITPKQVGTPHKRVLASQAKLES